MVIHLNPVAFAIGSFEIRWYGIFVALAVVEIILWLLWQAKKGAKISTDTILMAAVVGIPSGVIVSRLLHVLDRWDYFVQNPGMIIGGEGLTIWGAVLGASLGLWIYSRFSNFKFGYVADLLAPAVILAQAIGRVGCIINGCCYGLATSSFWGVIYTHPGSYCRLGLQGIAVYPTQIFEIVYDLLVFGVLLLLKDRLKPDGSLYLVFLGLYSLWRFGIDFIREGTPFLFGLHQAQVIGLVVLAFVIPLLVIRTRWVKRSGTDRE